MGIKDEYNALPPEDIILPEDYGYRKKEENSQTGYVLSKGLTEGNAKKEKQKKNTLIKMFTGAVLSVAVITGVEGEDIFYRTHMVEAYVPAISEYNFEMAGTAYLLDDDTVCLTESSNNNSVGIVRSTEPIDLSRGFELKFDMLQSESRGFGGGNGGDGLSVSFSNVINDNPGVGGYLGYNGQFGVEFDLFGNPPEEAVGGEDYPGDHIAILKNSVWNAYSHTAPMSLDDNEVHRVRITYEDSLLTVYYDGKRMLESEIAASKDDLYVSIAGSCGDGTAFQTISDIRINGKKVLAGAGAVNNPDRSEQQEDSKPGSDIKGEDYSDSEYSADEKELNSENSHDSDIANEAADTDRSEVIEHDSNDTVDLITCAECNGYGIICPGSVEADDPEGCHGADIVSCKACSGTGREADGRSCSWCNGTLQHRCPSFEYHYECPVCEGKGVIER